jgi:mutator protein MutT
LNKRRNRPHYHVTAGLLWRDGRILITRRPEGGHLGGFWEFPGGKLEGHETLRECLEREIREELGIEVRANKRLLDIDHEYEKKSICLHLFECAHMSGEPQPLECAEMRWVRPQDLENYRLPPPDVKMIPFIEKWSEGRSP